MTERLSVPGSEGLLLLLDDGSPVVADLARRLPAVASFETQLATVDDLENGDGLAALLPRSAAPTWLAVDGAGDTSLHARARAALEQRLGAPFTNVLRLVCADSATLAEGLASRNAWFPVRDVGDPPHELVAYVSQLFRCSVLQRRLDEYMADAVAEMVSGELLRQKNAEIARLNRELERLSRTDGLTGLYNRAAVLDLADRERSRSFRPRRGTFSIALFDIDHFKTINDTHGHLFGDQVLRRFASLVQSQIRAVDAIGRFGGEEFLAVLPDAALDGAVSTAERVRGALEAEDVRDGRQERVRVTVSVGVAELSPEDDRLEDVIARADEALYRAKADGRNCVRRLPD